MTQQTPSGEHPDNLTDVPSVADYRRVFPDCVRKVRSETEKKRGQMLIVDMLKAHYESPDRTTTARALAEHFGLTSTGAANLKYGNFAKALCAELGRTPKYKVAILATFDGGRPDDDMVRWTMLPQVATALEELGWIGRK